MVNRLCIARIRITVTATVIMMLLFVDVAPVYAFLPGRPGPWVSVTPSELNVTAGDTVFLTVYVAAFWQGWFNVSVGSSVNISRSESLPERLPPLRSGVKAIYPGRIYLEHENQDRYSYTFPVAIRTQPWTDASEVRVAVLVSGIYRGPFKEVENETFTEIESIRLVVEPLVKQIVTLTTTLTLETTRTQMITSTLTSTTTMVLTKTTTILKETIRSTTTEWETEPSVYVWAIGTTTFAIILATVIILRKRKI